ncbi:MAG: hypothetical protein EP332_05155 [Bacteroidetes bacterium]|nr:MAG: hypothetical protein EP332_05155 [Bacteroidota bacterium]
MKKIILFAALATVVGISACSKDETPDNTGNTTGTKTCRVASAQGTIFGENASMALTYDANKRLTRYVSTTGVDSEGSNYYYNAAGELTKEEAFDGTAGTDITSKIEYTWSGGKITKIDYYYDNNGSLELESTGVPTYDGTRIVSILVSENGSESSKDTYTYDANGNVLSVTSQESDGQGGWNNTYRDVYEYDTKKVAKGFDIVLSDEAIILSPNNRTRELSQSYDDVNQTWKDDSDLKYTYAYNADGYPTQISLGALGNINLTYTCD